MDDALHEFLFANNWFQTAYAEKIEPRKYPTFKAALNIFIQNEGETIVETGTIRLKDDWGAGYSTYLFGDFCTRYNKRLISVDNNPKNLAISKEVTEPFKTNVTHVCMDSIEFLNKFSGKIDLLYLDSLDCDAAPDADNTVPQVHQLNELKAAMDKLNDRCVILLDDCIFTNGGKCRLTRDFLLDNEFVLILDYFQSLWVKYEVLWI